MDLGHLASRTFKRVNPRGAPNLADRAKKRKLDFVAYYVYFQIIDNPDNLLM
jgi:hypothetical protein